MSRLDFASLLLAAAVLAASVARADELPKSPIQYVGPAIADSDLAAPDARLRPAVGTQLIQVFRADRKAATKENPWLGFTYSHQGFIAYWGGRFWVDWLIAPVHEHDDPTHTALISSSDGFNWDAPRLVFPAIEYKPGQFTISHMRASFYVAPNGKFLVTSFQGMPTRGDLRMPNQGYGIGRLVREIKEDGSFGPIYFIRNMPNSNSHDGGPGYDEQRNKKWYPYFLDSPDEAFRAACTSMLDNHAYRQQWWEEDRYNVDHGRGRSNTEPFFPINFRFSPDVTVGKAFSYWTAKDGRMIGIWKTAHASESTDGGKTFSTPAPVPGIEPNTSKYWGQQTSDGRWALVYNPKKSERFPLTVATSDDGLTFDNLLAVHGEVAGRKYGFKFASRGPNYVRGILPGNGNPPDGAMWLIYDDAAEDMWVASVPVPITGTVQGPVKEDFESMTPGGAITGWNIYSPMRAPVKVRDDGGNKVLSLSDGEVFDYAKATRVFATAPNVKISYRVKVVKPSGRFDVEVEDRHGERMVQLSIENGELVVIGKEGRKPVGKVSANQWKTIGLEIDHPKSTYALSVDGKVIAAEIPFADPAGEPERLTFRTGGYRGVGAKAAKTDSPDIDKKIPTAEFVVDDVTVQ